MAARLINPLFLGVTRFQLPLTESTRKKFDALAEIGNISVIGFNRAFRFTRFFQSATFYLLPNVPHGICSYFFLCSVGLVASVFLLISGRANVVIAQSPYEGFPGAIAVRVARAFGRSVALVVESHGDFENALFLYRRTRFIRAKQRVMKCVADFSIRSAHALRSISMITSNQLKAWNSTKQMFQFPTWTDLDVFLHAFPFRKPHKPPRILFVGALVPIKGLPDLINAFALVVADLDAAKLTIIGESLTTAYLNELREVIQRLKLEDHVEFLGSQPQTVIAECMRSASVLVVPSLSEGFCRVVLEGMAAGVPVVATNIGAIPELICDGVTGFLVEPGNRQMLAATIKRVVNGSSSVDAMTQRAHTRALEVFSTDKYVASYRELLVSALRAV